jgi:hypothetical protein
MADETMNFERELANTRFNLASPVNPATVQHLLCQVLENQVAIMRRLDYEFPHATQIEPEVGVYSRRSR